MCERMKNINEYYEALAYEINKQEALEKISTLHNKLKFKNHNNLSDKFLQTASLIENNLSVFKSACDHVDIVTTLIDHLYLIGMKLMFDKTLYIDKFNIIYLMFIICEEHEIPSFLKMAIIKNSMLININESFEPLISNYTIEMIVFEDSDLYAVISYLKIKPSSLLNMKKIFVQESIKQKFLWLLEKNFKYFIDIIYRNLSIVIFHTRNELFTCCTDSLLYFNMMSIWSEDITAAKALAMKLQKDIIFINAHLEFDSGIQLPFKEQIFNLSNLFHNYKLVIEDEDIINSNTCTGLDLVYRLGLVYDHFYNGTWQKPVEDLYWICNDVYYARATREDIKRCSDSAMEAYKIWNDLPIISRIEILNNLASTLECNGKILLAKTVSTWIKLTKMFQYVLTRRDEKLELITIRAPRGIIFLYHDDEVTLFKYLTISLFTGNCVIILHNKNTCTLAPYCNMFSTSEIPPGVINLLSDRNMYCPDSSNYANQLDLVTSPKNIILPFK